MVRHPRRPVRSCHLASFRHPAGKLPYVPRSTGCRRAFWLTAAAASQIRILVALLVRGYEVDMNCFTAWRCALWNRARGSTRKPVLRLSPGYLYLLWRQAA